MNTVPTITAPVEPVSEVSQQAFRDAMAKMAAAVNIITTDGLAGKAGFAATAVCSVTDSPASLLICLNRSASVFETVIANGVVCVNVLSADHQALSSLFGGKTPVDERFAAADWHVGATGAPMLSDAVVSFDCVIIETQDIGTHRILFCSVKAIEEREASAALLYFKRGYHHLQA